MKSSNENLTFFQQVYEVVRLIPFGRVTSYGAIARAIGSPGAARMVGWALNGSTKIDPDIPAHRVVNRNGLLTGSKHFGNNDAMSELLKNEGITVENNKILNFKELFWNPIDELSF